jgi:hypothetical protein
MLTDPVTSGEFQEQSAVEATGYAVVDILYGGQVAQLCGSDTKLAQAVRRYLFTVFGYGCNLGPNQTARHASGIATAPSLRRINAQHINVDKLEAAMVDVINQYVRFPLPRHWGGGRTAIADGTHVKLHENNLIGSRHIRYGGYGGIAYHLSLRRVG